MVNGYTSNISVCNDPIGEDDGRVLEMASQARIVHSFMSV